MMAGRDTKDMVNMRPCLEDYKISNPQPQAHGEWRWPSTMNASYPFLTNSRDLASGDLLVLPFDGGVREIFCESFPPIQTP